MQHQDCYRDEYGNVIFTYKNAELVRVSCLLLLQLSISFLHLLPNVMVAAGLTSW